MPARMLSPGLARTEEQHHQLLVLGRWEAPERLNCSIVLPFVSVICFDGIETWLNGTAVA